MQRNKYVFSVLRNFSHPSVSTEIKIYHVRDVRDVNCSFIWGLMRASLVAQLVKNLPAMRETWVGKIPWRRERLPTPVSWPEEFHGLQSMGLQELDMIE